jgi:putative transcriptional regulator
MPRPERTEPVLYNRLAVLRAERDLSRQELAEGLGVNYQTIGYLERGEYNPSLELALRAAEYFGLPVEAIFGRRPFPPMSSQLYAAPPLAGATSSPMASRPGDDS